MSREIIIIRHAKSAGNRHNRAAFGKEGAPLTQDGVDAAKLLTQKLIDLGIDVENELVAVSELVRTKQTAEHAGFRHTKVYKVLNEINSGLEPHVLDAMLERNELPATAINAAKDILRDPPGEKIWVTHGQVIAALAHELNIPTTELFIPDMASITIVHIP